MHVVPDQKQAREAFGMENSHQKASLAGTLFKATKADLKLTRATAF